MYLFERLSKNTRVVFAVLYKFFQNEARFPYEKTEVPKSVVEFIAKQIDIDPNLFDLMRSKTRK